MFSPRVNKFLVLLAATSFLGACETPAPTTAATTTKKVARNHSSVAVAASAAPTPKPAPMPYGARQTGSNLR